LIHNELLIQSSLGTNEDSTAAGWLPMYHDMGLIGNVIGYVFAGVRLTIMRPASTVQKPFRWLKVISDQRIKISGGPNFIYDLCVTQITEEQKKELDLSCWQLAFNGAEPINPETMLRFAKRFLMLTHYHYAKTMFAVPML